MEEKALKRVYAGYYTRWDKKRIYVVRVVKDIDTGEETVICKDASFSKKDNRHLLCHVVQNIVHSILGCFR